MSDDKSQQTESETAPAGSSANPADGDTKAEADVTKREWKPTPKFDYSKVVKAEKKAPKEPEPDILVVTSPAAEADFPYGVAAVMALLLLVAVYTATATSKHGHGEGHGDAHGAMHEAPPTAGVAHAATHTDTKEAAAPVRAAPQPRPRTNKRARIEQPAHAQPKPAAGEVDAEPPKPEAAEPPKPEAAEPPKPEAAEPPKPAEPEPAKPAPKPAATGGLAQAQADFDERKWFAAYRGAKDVYQDTKSEDALALMGLAACRTKKQDKVEYVLKRLNGGAADEMKKLCKDLGVPTK